MNLHHIVRGAITSVNPDIRATLLRSNGYVTGGDGRQIPSFFTYSGKVQVQAVTGKDLEHTNSLNIQGVLRTVYIYGNWAGVVRADQKGGDILKFPQVPGAPVQDWRVVMIKETWPDWCAVVVALQNGTTT